MTKLDQYLLDVQQEFRDNFPEGPKLTVKCKEMREGESFHAKYAAGELILEASGQKAAIFGVGLLAAGVASGHLGEYLDRRTPKFPLRPLRLPFSDNAEVICRQALALGYNAIMVDFSDMEALEGINFAPFQDYGVKLILQPKWPFLEEKCFLDSAGAEEIVTRIRSLQQIVPGMDGLFWEGTFGRNECDRHSQARDLLPVDIALREVQLLENVLQDNRFLIYYIPCKGEEQLWLPRFCDDVGKKTKIAFSVVDGDPTHDHLAPHPFWEALRRRPDPCYTSLMPIVNLGGVGQGECLWPTLSLDLIHNYESRCYYHRFEGVVTLLPRLPKRGSLLFGNLWIASHTFWGQTPSEWLAETWLAAFRPQFKRSELERVRYIALELSRLRCSAGLSSEEARLAGESLLAQIKQLEFNFNRNEEVSFLDYFTLFACDARRIILNFFQAHHVSTGNFLGDDGDQESFWTAGSQSMGATAPFLFHEKPQEGEPGSVLRRLYDEEVSLVEKDLVP